MEVSKPPTIHVKKILPPTLGGFPGEAEIRYYVKATVARPSMFQENARFVSCLYASVTKVQYGMLTSDPSLLPSISAR